MSKAKIVAGGLTQAEIDTLKSTKGEGKRIMLSSVKKGSDVYNFWFKQPNMDVMESAAALARNPLKSTRVYFDNCLIKGDAEIVKKDSAIWLKVAEDLQELVEELESEVKNF